MYPRIRLKAFLMHFCQLVRFAGACFRSAATALSLLLPLFFPAPVRAELVLLVDVDSGNPPFMYGTATQAEGFYPELVAAAFERMKRPVQLSAKPWKRALAELDLGIAGVAGIYKTDERLKKYDFSESLFAERIAVYYNITQPVRFKELSDLYGKRIGVLLGWSYGDAFDRARSERKFMVEEVYNDSQNFEKLAQGRVDAVLAIEQVGAIQLRNIRFSAIERSPAMLAEKTTHLALPKQMHAGGLLVEFNQVLQDMRKDGTYARILGRMESGVR
jgi:polar amino acid transport system substrate-binding protein